MQNDSVIPVNGLTVSISIKRSDQPAIPAREPFDYDEFITRLLSDARFVEELGKRLGLENLVAELLALKARTDSPQGEDGTEPDSQPAVRPRVNGYAIPCAGTSAHLFSSSDIYGQVWGMGTRNFSPLLRASIDPEQALHMTDDELLSGNYRMFGQKALEELKAKRRPLNYRGIHIPSERQYEEAVRCLERFRDADETDLFAYHLAGNQTVISTARSFRAIAEIMMQNGIVCREFAVDPDYPRNAVEEV